MKFRKMSFCILLFSLLVSGVASADPSVQSMADPNADNVWLRPTFKVFNNDSTPMDMTQYTVEYYFYDTALNPSSLIPSVWNYGLGSPDNVNVEILELDPSYTGGAKKADRLARMSFSAGSLSPGAGVDVALGIRATDWSTFDQQDDWSYMASTSFQENENFVVRDVNGDIVFGEEPGDDTVPRPPAAAVYWLGAHTHAEMQEISLNEGDAYRNTEDGKAYVYYQNGWRILDDNALSGGEMANSESHLNMNGSNVVNAGTIQGGTLESSSVTSTTMTVSGQVEAGSFTGDGSGLTNLRLENGSVLFEHLAPSTLDALVAYISERIVVPDPIVSVVANPGDAAFDLRRMGSAAYDLLVSYTVTQISGASRTETALFPAGENTLQVDGYAGEELSINANPEVYIVDPLHSVASIPRVTISMTRAPFGDYTLHFERNVTPGEDYAFNVRVTHIDGTSQSGSIGWFSGQPNEIDIDLPYVGYGDIVELLPSAFYDIDPAAGTVEFPVITMSMTASTVGEYHLHFERDFTPGEDFAFNVQVTHADGSSESGSIGWFSGQPNEIDIDLPYVGAGDFVELLSSIWYGIDPAAGSVRF